MKILLAEDEPNVAGLINKGLVEKGHSVTVAPDGALGLDIALTNSFDVMILDIMLPNMSGMELCKQLRQKNIFTPILFLTALGTTENIVAGLNAGGDDYLVKPFKFAELEARLKSLHRRKQVLQQEDESTLFGNVLVNLASKIVTYGGEQVNLTSTEFRLLEYLLKNKNRVVSRIEILEHVWGIDFNMGTNVVDVYVNYLRKKIDKDPAQKFIQTVIGMGYMLKI
ncbi:MAG TPA: response regulator transcription factor [Ferruginibacter sp.]|nr:response regulator transcription factor [Ferruginibacter sp.]HPH90476.1 response regulator transcription factor [Ferruginibacter sp.]